MKITFPPLVRISSVLLALALALAFPSLAQSSGNGLQRLAKPAQDDSPLQVKVGIYILTVGNLDMTTGNYTMDFFLNFSCDRPCDPDTFDIMNGEITFKEDQTSSDADGTWRSYRVRASLLTDLDVRRYPFDEHDLVVEIEDKLRSNKALIFVPDESNSGVDSNAVVSGWQLRPKAWAAEVIDHEYPIFSSKYSRYRFYVTIYHPWQSSFLKALFAPLVIVIVGLLSLLMKSNKISDKLALTTSSLVGAILYHLSLISSIPPVGYLTFADKFMIVNYVVVSAALGVTVVMMVYNDNDFYKRAERLNKISRLVIPLLWAALLAWITITEFVLA
jgi:hypothetical protein